MDIASILEEYLADISTLPGDVAFILDEIKVKDQKLVEAQRRIAQKDGAIQKHVKANGALSEFNKEQVFYPKIRSDFQECISLQQEKFKLAAMGLYLVMKHVKKLDAHVAGLEAEGILPPVSADGEDNSFSFATNNSFAHHTPNLVTAQSLFQPQTQILPTPARAASTVSSASVASATTTHTNTNTSNNATNNASNTSTSNIALTEKPVRQSSPLHNPPQTKQQENVTQPRIPKRSSDHQRQPPNDEGDEKFCFCKKGSVGNMIACDGETCEIEWFHWECVGLTEDPKGSWYCPQCKEKNKHARTK